MDETERYKGVESAGIGVVKLRARCCLYERVLLIGVGVQGGGRRWRRSGGSECGGGKLGLALEIERFDLVSG